MTALAFEGVSAGYGDASVIRDLDLTVGDGEVVALLGPNGAGKTTTLRTILGATKQHAGTVSVLGRAGGRRAAARLARHGVTLLPDDRGLFPQMTVKENLRIGHRRGRTAVDEAIGRFPDLAGRLDVKAGVLSGGQQQMLGLARAISSRPRLLLVDEMSHGLAPLIVRQILPVLQTIARDDGAAVLFVEQHVDLALEISDRAYVLANGRIALSGRSEELASDRQRLAASYLGTPHPAP
jgi:branched-chain amino acid transport system ATP-binding protein